MRIELLDKKYIAPLVEIEAECFGQCAWNEEAFAGELGNKYKLCLVALEDESVIGCVAADLTEDTAFISKLMITAAFRRKKAATALMQALYEACRQRGIEQLSLEVRASNLPAIGFYTAQGFDNIGKRRNFYRFPKEDAVIMSKQL